MMTSLNAKKELDFNVKPDLLKCLQVFDAPHWLSLFSSITRGLEKECLRVDNQGRLAKTLHPETLGSSLMHPMITTDYSEALLEFITPPTTHSNELFKNLTNIHQYAYHCLDQELLWSCSMPCALPREEEIPIAQYGRSNLGMLKHIYRQGLGLRYGRMMQTIAGIHYNFSLPLAFWAPYHDLIQSKEPLQAFISEQYLVLIRNYLRFGWLVVLLFGSSPAVSNTFFQDKKPNLTAWREDTFIGDFATSLRLSDLGYHNRVQSRLSISYNTYPEYLETLKKAVQTKAAEYNFRTDESYCQLSDNLLQLENEHYAFIRPKRVVGGERMLTAMQKHGIEYIEVRSIDVNPFIPIGCDPHTVYFLDAFLISCLLMDSPPISHTEYPLIAYNYQTIATSGRKPELCLLDSSGKSRNLQSWSIELLDRVEAVAHLLDKAYASTVFTGAVATARENIRYPDRLPSARVLQEMSDTQESFFEFALRWSKHHQQYFKHNSLTPTQLEYYSKLAERSLLKQQALENSSEESFRDYLCRYLKI